MIEEKKEELLPCPFCGGKPTEGWLDGGAPRGYVYIACENDNCPTSQCYVERKGLFIERKIRDWNIAFEKTKEKMQREVRKLWNTRKT